MRKFIKITATNMKKVTKEFEVFSFSELKPDVQARLIEEQQRTTLEGYDWWENTYDNMKRLLAGHGFTDVDIYFSGFWSQGDGACFDATIDLYEWMKSIKMLGKYRTIAKLAKEGWAVARIRTICTHYSHEHTRRASIELDSDRMYSKKAEEELEVVEGYLEFHRCELSKQIYKALEAEYDYQTSEEQAREYFESTNFEFLSDGERFDV